MLSLRGGQLSNYDPMGGCFLFGNFLSLRENSEGGWVVSELDSVGWGTKDKCISKDGRVEKSAFTYPHIIISGTALNKT